MEGITVALISTVVGIFATTVTLYRETKKTTQSEAQQTAIIKEQLKYISKGVDDIKYETRTMSGLINELKERLVKAEEGLKNLEIRVVKIEEE